MVVDGVALAAARYAAVADVCAASDWAFATWVLPEIEPGGKPVREVPGESPRSPVTTVEPVLVIVEPARTAYEAAEPRFSVVAPDAGSVVAPVTSTIVSAPMPTPVNVIGFTAQ